MLGNTVSEFALGLLIFNKTSSTFLYGLFFIVSAIPKVLLPALAGPYIDRFSRRKIVYSLDFIMGLSYLVVSFLIYIDFYSYPAFLLFGFWGGSVFAVYNVAYESFYPTLISEGNFTKAYSISSLIYPIANTVMVPIAAMVYKSIGLMPLFLFSGIAFVITSGVETQICVEERHLKYAHSDKERLSFQQNFVTDFVEGARYLKHEKGLWAITAYFFCSMLTYGVTYTLLLPYFSSSPNLTVTDYSIAMSVMTLGRIIGGIIHYRYRYPTRLKFKIAVFVYVATSVLEGTALLTPFKVLLVMYLLEGVLSVTSYNIRISSTQNYVPDYTRGRFNGLFAMITTSGTLIGQFVGGALGEFIPIPLIAVGAMVFNLCCIYSIVIRKRSVIQKIYNVRI